MFGFGLNPDRAATIHRVRDVLAFWRSGDQRSGHGKYCVACGGGGHQHVGRVVAHHCLRGDIPDPTAEGTTVNVIDTDELVGRNAEFAASRSFAGLTLRPSGSMQVIGCVDPRVAPSHVLGLKLGESAEIRNVGGRVTPATLRTLAMLAKVVRAHSDGPPPGDYHYVVLQHTGCGIMDLTAFPDLLAEYFEVPASDLDAKAVTDPAAAVRVDVEVLRQALPAGVYVSGLVYDVATGLIEIIVPTVRVKA